MQGTERFLLGDGAVYVWYDDAIVPVPQVDGSLTATGALVLCGHTEHNLVGSFAQVQVLLVTGKELAQREVDKTTKKLVILYTH